MKVFDYVFGAAILLMLFVPLTLILIDSFNAGPVIP